MKLFNKIKLNIKALRNILSKEKELINNNKLNLEKSIIYKNVLFSESTIGDYSYISSNSIIQFCDIGKFCSIGPNVTIGFGEHPIHFLSTSPIFYAAKDGMFNENFYSENSFEHHSRVTIGNDVWIGANVYVKNGVTIGDGAVIGAGAVVTKSVQPYAIVAGVPAKVLKMRFSNEKIDELLRIQWWNWSIEKLKENKTNFTNINGLEMILKKENYD